MPLLKTCPHVTPVAKSLASAVRPKGVARLDEPLSPDCHILEASVLYFLPPPPLLTHTHLNILTLRTSELVPPPCGSPTSNSCQMSAPRFFSLRDPKVDM